MRSLASSVLFGIEPYLQHTCAQIGLDPKQNTGLGLEKKELTQICVFLKGHQYCHYQCCNHASATIMIIAFIISSVIIFGCHCHHYHHHWDWDHCHHCHGCHYCHHCPSACHCHWVPASPVIDHSTVPPPARSIVTQRWFFYALILFMPVIIFLITLVFNRQPGLLYSQLVTQRWSFHFCTFMLIIVFLILIIRISA